MAPRWGQDGEQIEEKRQRNKKGAELHRVAPFWSKKWPTWPQLGSPNGATIAKKSIQKSSIFLMPLGIDLWVDYGGFLVPQASQVGTKRG